MGLEEQLYEELYELRERLREEAQRSTGRVPNVCSDDALREIAQRVPTKIEDFIAIVGIGQRFLEVYGEDFLKITKKYAVTAAKGSDLESETAKTLRELEKKLINISRGNRLLYQGKISAKNTFDLMRLPDLDPLGLIFGSKRVLRLCDIAASKDDEKVYKHLNQIIREVNRGLREKGQYDLYMAYPFVQGKMPNDDFDIRAPLALFPVTLEKDARTITLTYDSSRDAMYNNTLILAYIKATGQNRPLPNNILEDFEEEDFIENLLNFFEMNGITIKCENRDPTEFEDYKAGQFPDYPPGEMELVPNIVLGKYPMYSSSIQRDFDAILAGKEINGILTDLVENLDKTDFLSDKPEPLSFLDLKKKGLEASEKDLVYINSLNSAQENILTAIDKQDEIVVQGPPGTGKSQVITGLITSAVVKGKTVLMVSEKKTALDVVYSRLGNLAKYCLLIDDVGNKDLFYNQLDHMLSAGVPKKGTDLEPISKSIDDDVRILSNIANVMYTPDSFGVAPYKLYGMERIDLTNEKQFSEYKVMKDNINRRLMDLPYRSVTELHRMFGDIAMMRNFNSYRSMVSDNPWLTKVRTDLSEYDVGSMKADLMDIEMQMKEFNSKGFVSRLFSKGKVTRETTKMIDRYFFDYNQYITHVVMDDPQQIIRGLDDYEEFASLSTVYNKLNDDEKLYGDNVLMISDKTSMDFIQSNDRIYNWMLNEHLLMFDAAHKDIMQQIWDFDSIVRDIDRKMEQKREQCRDRVEEILQENLRYISESKRRGDINRIIESKRKWNLNKFINRYSYELFKGVRVWLLTPEVVSEILPLDMGVFDLLIFDEASQMYVEKGIPSIYRAKKVIVAGDHKQLRPSSLGVGRIEWDSDEDDLDDDISGALEEESLLDLARARYDSIMLNFHYRSKYEELIAFSNYAFYGGRLYVSPNVVEPERPPIEVIRVDGLWENKSNRKEAEKVIELLRRTLDQRKNNETIGIITFNASQRDLINDMLDDKCDRDTDFAKTISAEMKRYDNGEDVGLFIKNIEAVQGDERDIIIFSIGYAKNSEGKLMQRFGWLNNRGGENRLNVAISRAKKKIYIVSSFEPKDLQVEENKNEGPRILKKYLQYADAISNGDRELADEILHSFGDERWTETEDFDSGRIADKVYNALMRKGYTVERNVGIGGYQIDLAVKQDNKYILGIECDSRLYEISRSTRERDYHRQKYLESRGWRIHRVWTPGFWKNPDKEISRIIDAIERK
ncbi:MAG: DUF4011 domain-containing protein [Thermoplasmata archaeon]|nr:DUF4011 domain-containing protein [Thermoplasmata archaeon]